MVRELGRRAVGLVTTALLASFLIFSSLYLAPGDPVTFLVGPHATQVQRDAVRAQYHLDQPLLVQFWDWLTGIFHGDLGQSTIHHQSVESLVQPRLSTTFVLVLMAAVWMLLFGIGSGLLAGVRGGRVDGAVTGAATVALSVPSFVAAVLLITVFAVRLGWFPILGDGTGVVGRLHHLFLPSVALAIAGGAYLSRITRTAVREESGREHVLMARGRGLPDRVVVRRHVLRNALVPITTVAGLAIAGLLAGTAVVETAFSVAGIGSLLVDSVMVQDFAVVQAISLILVVAFVVMSNVVDLLYVLIDPRMRSTQGRT